MTKMPARVRVSPRAGDRGRRRRAEVAQDVHRGLDEVRHGSVGFFSEMGEPARGAGPDGPWATALARVGGVGG